MTTPSNKLSVIKVFEPAPRINIFSLPFSFFIKLINSFKLSALKKTFDFPPILNQFFFFKSCSNLTFSPNSFNKFLSSLIFIRLFPEDSSSN